VASVVEVKFLWSDKLNTQFCGQILCSPICKFTWTRFNFVFEGAGEDTLSQTIEYRCLLIGHTYKISHCNANPARLEIKKARH
jgi:hypothetical protein